MNDNQIKHMVERFLSWKLPEDFNPDAGISFQPKFNVGTPYEMSHNPTGTNLFDYTQAQAMVRHMLEGLPASLTRPESSGDEATVEFVLAAGSAGIAPPRVFTDEAEARAAYAEEVAVPSYFGPGHRRHAQLIKRTMIIEELLPEPNQAAIAAYRATCKENTEILTGQDGRVKGTNTTANGAGTIHDGDCISQMDAWDKALYTANELLEMGACNCSAANTPARMREALEVIQGMLAGYAGQPSHFGDVFKIADAALSTQALKSPPTASAGEAEVHRSDCAIYNEPSEPCDCHLVDPSVPPPDVIKPVKRSAEAAAFIAERRAEQQTVAKEGGE